MTYYDHGTSMVLNLEQWNDDRLNRQSVRSNWMVEKEIAELRTVKLSRIRTMLIRFKRKLSEIKKSRDD